MCRYRRAYHCTNAIQEASRAVLGHCLIEDIRYGVCKEKGLDLLGRKSWEEATPEEQVRIAAWGEAWVYQVRCLSYVLLRMAGEVDSPQHDSLHRYQLAAIHAEGARYRDLVPEVPALPELRPLE